MEMNLGQWKCSPAMIVAYYGVCSFFALLYLGGSIVCALSSAYILASVCAMGAFGTVYLMMGAHRVRSIKIDEHVVEIRSHKTIYDFEISKIERMKVFIVFDLWIKYEDKRYRFIGIPESVLNDLIASVGSQGRNDTKGRKW